jgi:uncharacterized protein involved in exopolysaccharide biosynthesis
VVLAVREGLQAETVMGTEAGLGESRRSRNARLYELLVSRPNLRDVIESEHVYSSTVAKLGVADAIEDLKKQINFVAGEGNTVIIQFEEVDPTLAQRVTRALGQSLVKQIGRDSVQRAESTRKFLEGEQAKVAQELQVKEEEYARFIAQHPEFALERTQPQAVGATIRAAARADGTSADTSDPSAAMRRQADRLRRRLEQLRGRSGEPASAATSPPAEPQLTPESREAIANAEREVQRAREELESRQAQFTPRHPDVVAAESRLASAQARLSRVRATAQVLAAPPHRPTPLPPAPAAATDRPEDLERQLRNIESAVGASQASARPNQGDAPSSAGTAAAIVSLETQWASLTREVAAIRDRYESLQRRLFQAVMVATAQSSGGGMQLVVTDDAYLPKRPYRRGPLRTGAVAAMLVMLLGCSLTLGLGYLDRRIVSEWELERLGIGSIALVVPRLPRRSGRKRSA